ncbi:hypothetical protein M409DRAFT_68098 [Zasmidium cellare ATCC 36951]|uniref:Uncharacterized protein n=1 Tax=Zasmidium cellare ATCC 36951 TaxID=1080233 RepID=A0A6A6CDH7_ZASCE|nr:uncharacterized protein M409DRAFT_68098 [Zasmidium cellare ATCC 36951]KAF2164228.1 hypothetical protein M409DRAFT_68098 [Zasmidium cellare ATCC 36951]
MASSRRTPTSYEQFKNFRTTFPAPFVAHVEINRPEKINAFDNAMFREITALFDLISHDPNVRVVMLSGAGTRGFSAGLDVMAESTSGPVGTPVETRDFARKAWAVRRHALLYQESVNALERCEKPIVCLLHVVTFGAAVDFATAADVRYCTRDVKLCVREIDAGLAPDVGTLSRLPKIGVPYSWAKEIIYSAEVVGGEEAARIGLASKVFNTKEEMVSSALAWATNVASKSPVAVQSSKALWDFSRDRPVADGLLYTAAWNSAMVLSDDVRKAMTSGLKRTQPTFEKL